jgi:hypothetical protein
MITGSSHPSIIQSNSHHPAQIGGTPPTTLMSALITGHVHQSHSTHQQNQQSLANMLNNTHNSQFQSSANHSPHSKQTPAIGINPLRPNFQMGRNAPPVIMPQPPNQEDDPVGDIIKLEDQSEPSSLTNSSRKYDTINTQVHK